MNPQPDDTAPQSTARDTTPEALRHRLVDQLRSTHVLRDPAVERALRTVPRHLFLPGVPITDAYADTAVPTHWAEGIPISSASQPAMVAIMLEQLQLEPGMRVLEIGAGTGYNAALLAELVGPSGKVITIDIDSEIVDEAREHLAAAGYPQVTVVALDGSKGWPAAAPYDRIMLTVGASDITPAWYSQLRQNGVLVLPLLLNGVEASVAFRKRGALLESESIAPCGFMRLRGEQAGPEQWAALPHDRKLFAEHSADLVEPISALLASRPRPRLGPRLGPVFPQYLQHLGLRGYRIVRVWSARGRPGSRRWDRGRYGVYVEGADGPSLALFSSTLPVLLVFGGTAAERVVETEMANWRAVGYPAIERWHIVAHPPSTSGEPPPASTIRLERRHFTFDLRLAPQHPPDPSPG